MKLLKVASLWDIVGGMFILILVYLLLSQGKTVNSLMRVGLGETWEGVRTLQGR